jgi:phospholipid/cholesterol/gamma-HCH transport system substrate-binding protein/paraquat-inducible protein B
MSTRPNYFKLGLFILIALFLLVTGIILFGSGIFGQKKIHFETYFTGSVSGLSVGASVQENGVEIGKVEQISFIRNDYEEFLPKDKDGFSHYRPYVRVICSVVNLPEMSHEERQEGLNILVKNGLRLRLSTNILTGQGFIEAEYLDPERYPVEEFPWETEYPYIPSAPSTFTTLKDSVDKILVRLERIETEKIADNLNEVLESVTKAVNDLDTAAIRDRLTTILDSANQAIKDARIDELSIEAREMIADAKMTNQHLQTLVANPDPQQDLGNIAELVDQMNITMARIDQLIRTESPRILEVRESLRQILDTVNRLVENLEENPSDLIFSQPPNRKENAQ